MKFDEYDFIGYSAGVIRLRSLSFKLLLQSNMICESLMFSTLIVVVSSRIMQSNRF